MDPAPLCSSRPLPQPGPLTASPAHLVPAAAPPPAAASVSRAAQEEHCGPSVCIPALLCYPSQQDIKAREFTVSLPSSVFSYEHTCTIPQAVFCWCCCQQSCSEPPSYLLIRYRSVERSTPPIFTFRQGRRFHVVSHFLKMAFLPPPHTHAVCIKKIQ